MFSLAHIKKKGDSRCLSFQPPSQWTGHQGHTVQLQHRHHSTQLSPGPKHTHYTNTPRGSTCFSTSMAIPKPPSCRGLHTQALEQIMAPIPNKATHGERAGSLSRCQVPACGVCSVQNGAGRHECVTMLCDGSVFASVAFFSLHLR